MLMWGVVYQGYNAVFPAFYQELFPTKTRVTAFAVSQNIGTLITAFLPAIYAALVGPTPSACVVGQEVLPGHVLPTGETCRAAADAIEQRRLDGRRHHASAWRSSRPSRPTRPARPSACTSTTSGTRGRRRCPRRSTSGSARPGTSTKSGTTAHYDHTARDVARPPGGPGRPGVDPALQCCARSGPRGCGGAAATRPSHSSADSGHAPAARSASARSRTRSRAARQCARPSPGAQGRGPRWCAGARRRRVRAGSWRATGRRRDPRTAQGLTPPAGEGRLQRRGPAVLSAAARRRWAAIRMRGVNLAVTPVASPVRCTTSKNPGRRAPRCRSAGIAVIRRGRAARRLAHRGELLGGGASRASRSS